MNFYSDFIFNIQRFSLNDGPGIRTTLFFRGCPLSCTWCHNPESWKFSSPNNEAPSRRIISDILDLVKKDSLFYEESGGGVTFSGGEPTMQPDLLFALLHKCREADINTAVDTCGYAPYIEFEKILPLTNLFLYDIKLFDEAKHLEYTGVSNKLILENLVRLSSSEGNINIRIPLIPEITDTEENLVDIINFLLNLPNKINDVSLLPFNEISKSKYHRMKINNPVADLQTQSPEKLDEISSRFLSAGFNIQLRGNNDRKNSKAS